MVQRDRVAALGCLIAAVMVLGCKQGNPNAPARVTGQVTYNGSPVTGGNVYFHPKEGGAIPAPIGPDGRYTAFDILDGEMVVTVETESINPDKKQPEYRGYKGGGPSKMYGGKAGGGAVVPKGKGMEMSPAPESSPGVNTKYMKIPAKYADPKTSGLTVTLVKGEQTHNIDLTD